ncbi:helix-turn-helix domain-containing protein [Rudanella paleaurantiibacter]|uniref:Helix-turn-helix domain-containing protein n=1 Tax=Rudanella paleaurantiibacter TaxID=2614655 RepID=A0A7J5U304_9BACT|nr:helix-turn-helix domain-containing protein [Rudanella paleaurantiibacter]KAB7732076.1 helix-turn-helix domain-containing protein [Rudanella paleaurantiibacter]
MSFYFSAYSSPLLFGFVQAWGYALLLWLRGRREERLSDILLGWVLVGMAFNIWEYMLGFGGIEILWNQLEFFPRTLGYLLPVLCYFYLRTQVNTDFRFSRRDGWHAVPFLIQVTYHLVVFAQGPNFVRYWKTQVNGPYHLDDLEFWFGVVIDLYYLFLSLRLYRQYRAWITNQFSETDSISFRWFRNFLIALTLATLFGFLMDGLSVALSLNFWQNWWDELAKVVLIYYISINGYAQVQPGRRLAFQAESVPEPVLLAESVPGREALTPVGRGAHQPIGTPPVPDGLVPLRDTLLQYMAAEKPYLEPDLSLTDLARRMHTNPVVLSQVINTGVGKNFNDFVNEYRVEEFKRQLLNPANTHLSFLGLALNCGFNSKATFNRAFRKFTGTSPKEFVGQ